MTRTEWDRRNRFYVKKIRLKKALIGLIIILVLATIIAVPLAITYWPKTPPPSIGEKDRIECPLLVPGNITECENRGCVWSEASAAPNCYMPKNIRRFNITNKYELPDGIKIILTNTGSQDMYSPSLRTVRFEVDYINNNIVRFTFQDEAKERYKVPVELEEFNVPQLKRKGNKNRIYEVFVEDYENSSFSFKIQRKNSTVLWDTTIGGFVFEEQFLQIATYLPSENIYGFGENPHQSFRHDLNYQTWPLFARDEPPGDGKQNLYGVHPFYTCLENVEGKSHGVLLLNSNAMEYTLLPSPGLSYRTIGGILDFFMFIGDSPEHVIQLYTELIGRPMMPPYWALGFQLCRYGYENITNLQRAVERTRNAQIPLDVQYVDIDHMEDNKVFTVDSERFPDLYSYVQQEQNNGLRWIIILDPALLANDSSYLPHASGLKNGKHVYITWPTDVPLESRGNPEGQGLDLSKDIIFGKVWPNGPVAFPDFLKPITKEWWEEQIVNYRNKTEAVKFDGLWIDMNEPANFGTNYEEPWYCNGKCWSLHCPHNEYDNPPYSTAAALNYNKELADKTICMVAKQGENNQYRHYDVHSLYGWSQTKPTLRAAQNATKARSIVISRSTYPSSGKYAGHWLGDNSSRWPDLHRSIIGMLEFNLFGIPYVGADICGFFGSATPELCMRWMQLGAFYPFARNHNGKGEKDQDPGVHKEVAIASKIALELRYDLLPYLYTLFYHAHVKGNTVVRPLFHEFWYDSNTWGIDTQFLWGPALLIAPVLEKGQKQVNVYLPKEYWYLYEGKRSWKSGSTLTVENLESPILFVRSGFIIPTQEHANNTKNSRQNPFTLRVYPQDGHAKGDLYWDDGEAKDPLQSNNYYYFTFELRKQTLIITKMVFSKDPVHISRLNNIYIFDVADKPTTVTFNGKTIVSKYVEALMTLTLKVDIDLETTDGPWLLTWEEELEGHQF